MYRQARGVQSLGGVVYIAENPALVATRADVAANETQYRGQCQAILRPTQTGIASNAGRINVNSNRIASNATNIASNTSLLADHTAGIASNTDLILRNSESLRTATKGIAGVGGYAGYVPKFR